MSGRRGGCAAPASPPLAILPWKLFGRRVEGILLQNAAGRQAILYERQHHTVFFVVAGKKRTRGGRDSAESRPARWAA